MLAKDSLKKLLRQSTFDHFREDAALQFAGVERSASDLAKKP